MCFGLRTGKKVLNTLLEGIGLTVSASGLGSGAAGLSFCFVFRFGFQVPVSESVSEHKMHRSISMVYQAAKKRQTLQGNTAAETTSGKRNGWA